MPGFEMFDQREIDAVADCLKRKMVHRYSFNDTRGGVYRVEEFENAVAAMMGTKHALAVNSGTASLYVALRAMGIGPGDEVVTSAFTFIASVEAILECGAIPVIADIDESLNLDPASAERCITERTKAIMPVHMYGASADMDAFASLCERYGLDLIEDSCQAMGATYKGRFVGSMGRWGAYSLDPYKLITVGEGGLIVTNDTELYRKMEHYHDHGHIHDKSIDRGAEGKACLGFNFRMSEIQGALGLVQLSKMQGAIDALRATKKRIMDAVSGVAGLSPRSLPDRNGEIATQVAFILPDADAAKRFQKASKEKGFGCGILSGNTWHFAKHWRTLREGQTWSRIRCPHDCPYSEDTPLYRPVDWEVTERILERTVAYSLNINTSDSQLDAMIGAVTTAAKAAL